MNGLRALLVHANEDIPLDIAALELATIEYPGLDVYWWVELLDSYAAELAERVSATDDGAIYLERATQFLFEELGFRGNDGDYYSPDNSCLNHVLMERTGLPITLSLVFIEISRRLHRPVYGIGLPGHFLVEYDDGDMRCFLDPFHQGRALDASECLALASRVTGLDLTGNLQVLQPVTKRQMALRMLNNLRAAYLRRGLWPKALQVQNLLVDASPTDGTEYRQRGYLHLQMRQYPDAARDLERYLELSPAARDREEVEKRLRSLQRWAAGRN